MTDDVIRRSIIQKGGCRLCMAPDSECVPIFATAAADKEPLSSKIQACVNIKIHQGDRLSARVCHACISYLNSWQSFKNRCYAAQKKQRSLLELWLTKERAKKSSSNQHHQSGSSRQRQQQFDQQPQYSRAQQQSQPKILKQVLSQPVSHSSPINQSQVTFPLNSSVDVSFIKEEPDDIPMDDEVDEMDPTQFLARDDNGDDGEDNDEADGGRGAGVSFNDNGVEQNYPNDGGPPILTSLGLTHINHVNPFSFLSTELANDVPPMNDTDDSLLMAAQQQPSQQMRRLQLSNQPACTICDMKFSNRANARRHERNIHGKNFSLMAAGPSSQSANNASSSAVVGMSGSINGASQSSRLSVPPLVRRRVNYPMADVDYSKPEQYRDLLTDSKLHFIKRHIEFLEQYQNMRCNCCDKEYPTYKFFMAHMRKRYNTLSRNLCFKCLTQFDTKPLFIAHLKKRNCVNLYRLYKADGSISKDPLPPVGRVGTKEIISNKVYGCKLCTKTFRLKVDFRGHVVEAHADEQKSMSSGLICGFCNMDFDDPLVRKRHYSNMECLHFLICGTCDDKFDNLPQYIEHVYATHLQPLSTTKTDADGSSSTAAESGAKEDTIESMSPSQQAALKYPQNCRVCGKLYNNYYNVLRHMESKHPYQLPGTYRCEKCNVGYPRQSELREHMYKIHGITLPKIRRENYFCRICGTAFEQKDFWLDHMATKYSRYYCSQCDMETENTAEFEAHLADHQRTQKMHQCVICQHSFNTEKGLETHMGVVHKTNRRTMALENGGAGGSGSSGSSGIVGRIDTIDSKDFLDELVIKKEKIDMDDNEVVELNGDNMYDNDVGPTAGIDPTEDDFDETFGNLRKRLKLDEISITKANKDTDYQRIKQCPMCPEQFTNGISLSNHMRSHQSSGGSHSMKSSNQSSSNTAPSVSIISSSSSRGGGSSGSVGRALGTYQINNRMRCRICQKRIHTKTSYKRHMLQVHQVRDCVFIRCQLCPAEFSNDKGLKVHMFRTHAITVQQMQEDESLRPVPKQESTDVIMSKAQQQQKLLTKIAPKLMFECDICHTVYRNKDQLKAHKSIVHADEISTVDDSQIDVELDDNLNEPQLPITEAWWQCRYCDENFNASKKLTIHMNSHEEHDTTDNTCKDCGKIYQTRKSLWVHRQKKHPRLPNPSTCELCNKVFFDKTELFHHLKTHSNADVFTHLQEMHQQLEDEQGSIQQKQHGMNDHHDRSDDELDIINNEEEEEEDNDDETNIEITPLPSVMENLSCHLCGQKFQNKRVLSKHLRLHEESDAYVHSPLAAMLADTTISLEENGSVEYNFPSYKGQMVDGEYACDMCPKTFRLMTALKVHRGWHFRSPDGRQVTDPANMWQPDTIPQSKMKRGPRSHNPPICPYCNSTFASGNNLRRHIVEVHKRNEAKLMRENGALSENVFVEKELECQACGITFNTRPEWIDHKISHARTMKPSTTFEWGCEICGKIFTRKERLLAHMVLHLNGKDEENSTYSGEQHSEMGGESNSRSSMSSQSHSQQSQQDIVQHMTGDDKNEQQQKQNGGRRGMLITKQKLKRNRREMNDTDGNQMEEYGDEEQEDDEEEEEDVDIEEDIDDNRVEDDDEEDDNDGQEDNNTLNSDQDHQDDDDGDDEAEEGEDGEEHQRNVPKSTVVRHMAAYSCDLCQVFFNTAKELRRHVTSHIINAPDITISETSHERYQQHNQQQQQQQLRRHQDQKDQYDDGVGDGVEHSNDNDDEEGDDGMGDDADEEHGNNSEIGEDEEYDRQDGDNIEEEEEMEDVEDHNDRVNCGDNTGTQVP